MTKRSFAAVALILITSAAPRSVFGADDPIKKMDRVSQTQRDWEKAREETARQLAAKNAELAKAKQDVDIDARVHTIEDANKENVKEAPDGIKDAVKSAVSGEVPVDAARTALKMTHNFIKAKQAEGEIVSIAYDDGQVMEKVADLQKQVEQLKKDLQVEDLVINAAQQQIAKLQSSVSLSAQLNALAGQLLAKAGEAQLRQQQRLEAEARAAEAARQQAAAAAAARQAQSEREHMGKQTDRPDRPDRPQVERSQPERSQPERSQPERSQPERSKPERSQPERSQPSIDMHRT
jgi:hypothetical protein